jgi:catechol 2,3-dioxygenase-like lactoylglutathione lyase family enzyme
MISGGNITVMVSNMDASVRFYTEVLGMKLINRFGDHWATVDAGRGLVIGLHPPSPKYPPPGTRGSMVIGLEINEPIQQLVDRLKEKGAKVGDSITRDANGSFADMEDPDGNAIYLWETHHSHTSENASQYSHA